MHYEVMIVLLGYDQSGTDKNRTVSSVPLEASPPWSGYGLACGARLSEDYDRRLCLYCFESMLGKRRDFRQHSQSPTTPWKRFELYDAQNS